MFSKLKNVFQRKSHFNKYICESSLLVNQDYIEVEDLLFVIEEFQINPDLIDEYLLIVLNRDLFEQLYHVRSKTLLTCHLILHNMESGEGFAKQFLAQQFLLSSKEPNDKDNLLDSKNWLTRNIHTPYYQYLQRLSANVLVFQRCKVYQYASNTNSNIQMKLIWLFKISNMMNFSFTQMDIIRNALVINFQEKILKKIVLVYWSDIVIFFNFLSTEILKILQYYHKLSVEICLQFFELYKQLIEQKNKVRALYRFRSYFDHDQVIEVPLFFDEKNDKLKEVEKYVSSMPKLQHKTSTRAIHQDHSISVKQRGYDNQCSINQISFDDCLGHSLRPLVTNEQYFNAHQSKLHTLNEQREESDTSLAVPTKDIYLSLDFVERQRNKLQEYKKQ